MNPLLIRADANTEIGTGHVMRCLALAQAWQDAGGAATFAMATQAPAVRARLESEGVHVVSISESPGSQADANRTTALAHELGARWVVVDGYHFDSSYQRAIKDAGLALLWIDDEAHAVHYCADIVLNQNLHAAEAMYAARESYTRLLLGPRYVLLRREFLKWRAWQREIPPLARKILVTLGGGDPDNVTLKVIQALKQIDLKELQVVVLIGATNPHTAELEAAVQNVPFSIRLESNVSDMPKLMAWADVAISGAGSTCWELAFMGLPSVVLPLAKNQIPIAIELCARQLATTFDGMAQNDEVVFSKGIAGLCEDSTLRAQMSKRARQWIDGKGAARAVRELERPRLQLRRVQSSDCVLIWEWANDGETRANSFSSAVIPWEAHTHWFEQKLASGTCFFYVALDQAAIPLGQIRFDMQQGEAVVSTSVAPQFRGNGYGTLLIELGSAELFNTTDARRIHAYVKPENQASVCAFLKAGYKTLGQEEYGEHSAVHLILDRNGH